ncbi:MAG: hypothetical protein U1F50_11965 [Rubrivivax sp.]
MPRPWVERDCSAGVPLSSVPKTSTSLPAALLVLVKMWRCAGRAFLGGEGAGGNGGADDGGDQGAMERAAVQGHASLHVDLG